MNSVDCVCGRAAAWVNEVPGERPSLKSATHAFLTDCPLGQEEVCSPNLVPERTVGHWKRLIPVNDSGREPAYFWVCLNHCFIREVGSDPTFKVQREFLPSVDVYFHTTTTWDSVLEWSAKENLWNMTINEYLKRAFLSFAHFCVFVWYCVANKWFFQACILKYAWELSDSWSEWCYWWSVKKMGENQCSFSDWRLLLWSVATICLVCFCPLLLCGH